MLESWWVGLERFDDRSDTFHRRLYMPRSTFSLQMSAPRDVLVFLTRQISKSDSERMAHLTHV